jgi:Ser/Thr protein kinase RdoA (MazF antagonist)
MRKIQNSSSKGLDRLQVAAGRFASQGRVVDLRECGRGNVHDTFLVTLEGGEENRFILQRMNTRVFRRPELVMKNMRTVTEHVRRRLQRVPLSSGRRWEVPRVLLSADAEDHWIDPDGSFWRAISFVDEAQPFDTVQDSNHAKEVGYALGFFHSLISDLPPEELADTLEGFHHTPRYLRHFDDVLAELGAPSSPEVEYALGSISEGRTFANVLEEAMALGRLALRPIHGDPKVNNIMIDTATHRAVSMIDLDTVKPGLVHYDIGDCLRSCCNLSGEETRQWEAVRFDSDLCRLILQGYLELARTFLTEHDYDYVYDAIRLIAFELGLRFFTDYLEGNVYFKAERREHNLTRALVQFKLAESIQSQEETICAVIRDLR